MSRWLKAGVAGILAAGVCLGGAAWSDARELEGRTAELQREARLIARLVAAWIQGGLEKHLTAMRQMANVYASGGRVGEKRFHSYAANTLKMNPACLDIAYVDPSLRIQRSYPPDPSHWRPVFDARSRPAGYAAVIQAARRLKPVLSSPMRLFDGRWGFVSAVPVVSGGHLLGVVVGACRGQEYFGSLVPRELSTRYEQVVLAAGTPIFMSDLEGPTGDGVSPVMEQFVFGKTDWEVRIRPQEQVVHDRLTAGRPAFWAMAWLFSMAFGALASTATLWAIAVAQRLQTQRVALVEARSRLDGAQEQLIQAEKMTALGELVAGVAHEINNPLTGIVGYTELLIRRKLPPPAQKHLERIAAEGERIVKIVRNILSFARKHAPERKMIDLNDVIEKTLELKAYHLRCNQIRVVQELASDLPKTLLDFHQMQQVLINLLNNAEQAMLEAGRGHTIRLTTGVVEGRIHLRVSDDGPGIPPDIRERVLEPFFTTKQENRGTGLGLSLCNGIIQEHGGRIRVESPPGEGATFIVELPIERAGVSSARPIHRSSRHAVASLRVLVVDDETSVLDFLMELLLPGGHKVNTASDVPEAIAKIATGAYDLIIADLKMPSGTAREIYTAVLELRPQLAHRIVFITGQVTGDEMADFLRSTGNDLILKPFAIQDLENAIARAAGR